MRLLLCPLIFFLLGCQSIAKIDSRAISSDELANNQNLCNIKDAVRSEILQNFLIQLNHWKSQNSTHANANNGVLEKLKALFCQLSIYEPFKEGYNYEERHKKLIDTRPDLKGFLISTSLKTPKKLLMKIDQVSPPNSDDDTLWINLSRASQPDIKDLVEVERHVRSFYKEDGPLYKNRDAIDETLLEIEKNESDKDKQIQALHKKNLLSDIFAEYVVRLILTF